MLEHFVLNSSLDDLFLWKMTRFAKLLFLLQILADLVHLKKIEVQLENILVNTLVSKPLSVK